jgi:hypothetical protein
VVLEQYKGWQLQVLVVYGFRVVLNPSNVEEVGNNQGFAPIYW